MSELKEQLSALIEAYAMARATGNEILVNGAGASLVRFLEGVELHQVQPEAEANSEEG